MSDAAPAEKRRTPRIEGLGHQMLCSLDGEPIHPEPLLRDLALDSLRFEVPGPWRGGLRHGEPIRGTFEIPSLGLHFQCRCRVARRCGDADAEGRTWGAALCFEDLDTAVRGLIRSLYPAGTHWPAALS